MHIHAASRCAIIVAHPDDEILWVGGVILSHPDTQWTIVTLCRKSDPDRAPRFFRVCDTLNAKGAMADLDDGPEQVPLPQTQVRDTIMQMLPSDRYDIIFTHGLQGEYTRHLRHEEVSQAVLTLYHKHILRAGNIYLFAYEDGLRQYDPRPDKNAQYVVTLEPLIWQEKYRLITDVYGYPKESWEARITPKQEAFTKFGNRKSTSC
jgi:LmbE family N-acetylglucosaminyl deacetylase